LEIKDTNAQLAGRFLFLRHFCAGSGAASCDQDGAAYIVHSGEHGSLKARARGHTGGATDSTKAAPAFQDAR
jgi:hypothetical protein